MSLFSCLGRLYKLQGAIHAFLGLWPSYVHGINFSRTATSIHRFRDKKFVQLFVISSMICGFCSYPAGERTWFLKLAFAWACAHKACSCEVQQDESFGESDYGCHVHSSEKLV